MFRALLDWIRPPQLHRVCCFHFGRCGSTLLGNMLNSHPQLAWHSELFHSLHENTAEVFAEDALRDLQRTIDQSNKFSFGFETKFQHLDHNGLNLDLKTFCDHLIQLGFDRFMVLRRDNYLRQAISVARGQQTKVWHVKQGSESPSFQSFEMDLQRIALGGIHRELIECFEFLDRTYNEAKQILDSLQAKQLWLNYEEDLLKNPQTGFEKTIGFIGLTSMKAETSLQKLDRRSIKDMVTNDEQIAQRLQQTRYAWMLD